jgi:hypothetical protein
MALPEECADSGVFTYLVSWLLEWSGIPETDWNNEFLSTSIAAADIVRELRYGMNIDFRKEHLSEGLYRFGISMRFSRAGHRT